MKFGSNCKKVVQDSRAAKNEFMEDYYGQDIVVTFWNESGETDRNKSVWKSTTADLREYSAADFAEPASNTRRETTRRYHEELFRRGICNSFQLGHRTGASYRSRNSHSPSSCSSPISSFAMSGTSRAKTAKREGPMQLLRQMEHIHPLIRTFTSPEYDAVLSSSPTPLSPLQFSLPPTKIIQSIHVKPKSIEPLDIMALTEIPIVQHVFTKFTAADALLCTDDENFKAFSSLPPAAKFRRVLQCLAAEDSNEEDVGKRKAVVSAVDEQVIANDMHNWKQVKLFISATSLQVHSPEILYLERFVLPAIKDAAKQYMVLFEWVISLSPSTVFSLSATYSLDCMERCEIDEGVKLFLGFVGPIVQADDTVKSLQSQTGKSSGKKSGNNNSTNIHNGLLLDASALKWINNFPFPQLDRQGLEIGHALNACSKSSCSCEAVFAIRGDETAHSVFTQELPYGVQVVHGRIEETNDDEVLRTSYAEEVKNYLRHQIYGSIASVEKGGTCKSYAAVSLIDGYPCHLVGSDPDNPSGIQVDEASLHELGERIFRYAFTTISKHFHYQHQSPWKHFSCMSSMTRECPAVTRHWARTRQQKRILVEAASRSKNYFQSAGGTAALIEQLIFATGDINQAPAKIVYLYGPERCGKSTVSARYLQSVGSERTRGWSVVSYMVATPCHLFSEALRYIAMELLLPLVGTEMAVKRASLNPPESAFLSSLKHVAGTLGMMVFISIDGLADGDLLKFCELVHSPGIPRSARFLITGKLSPMDPRWEAMEGFCPIPVPSLNKQEAMKLMEQCSNNLFTDSIVHLSEMLSTMEARVPLILQCIATAAFTLHARTMSTNSALNVLSDAISRIRDPVSIIQEVLFPVLERSFGFGLVSSIVMLAACSRTALLYSEFRDLLGQHGHDNTALETLLWTLNRAVGLPIHPEAGLSPEQFRRAAFKRYFAPHDVWHVPKCSWSQHAHDMEAKIHSKILDYFIEIGDPHGNKTWNKTYPRVFHVLCEHSTFLSPEQSSRVTCLQFISEGLRWGLHDQTIKIIEDAVHNANPSDVKLASQLRAFLTKEARHIFMNPEMIYQLAIERSGSSILKSEAEKSLTALRLLLTELNETKAVDFSDQSIEVIYLNNIKVLSGMDSLCDYMNKEVHRSLRPVLDTNVFPFKYADLQQKLDAFRRVLQAKFKELDGEDEKNLTEKANELLSKGEITSAVIKNAKSIFRKGRFYSSEIKSPAFVDTSNWSFASLLQENKEAANYESLLTPAELEAQCRSKSDAVTELLQAGKMAITKDPDLALQYFSRCLELSEKQKNHIVHIKGYIAEAQAMIYLGKSYYDKCREKALLALSRFEKCEDISSTERLVGFLSNLSISEELAANKVAGVARMECGFTDFDSKRFRVAATWFDRAVESFIIIGDKISSIRAQGWSKIARARSFWDLRQFPECLEYSNAAGKLFKEIGDKNMSDCFGLAAKAQKHINAHKIKHQIDHGIYMINNLQVQQGHDEIQDALELVPHAVSLSNWLRSKTKDVLALFDDFKQKGMVDSSLVVGWVAEILANAAGAEDLLARATEVIDTCETKKTGRQLYKQAQAAFKQNQFEIAIPLFAEAEQLFDTSDDHANSLLCRAKMLEIEARQMLQNGSMQYAKRRALKSQEQYVAAGLANHAKRLDLFLQEIEAMPSQDSAALTEDEADRQT